jgi:hypothetical protein
MMKLAYLTLLSTPGVWDVSDTDPLRRLCE